MARDLNNELGFPRKYQQCYFRSWGAGAASGGVIGAAAEPSTSELVGTGLSVNAYSNISGGTAIQCVEAGLYFVSFSIRISTGSAFISATRDRVYSGNTIGTGTPDQICAVTAVTTGTRYAASGVIFLNPGDNIYLSTNAAYNVTEFTWQICRISPTL